MVVVGAGAFFAPAQAEELLILAGSDGESIRDCAQQDVVISGNRSKFVLAGGCHSLSIPGDGNQVLVEFGDASELYLRGNDNRIAWKKLPGAADPTILSEGRSNSILQFSSVTAKADIPDLSDHGLALISPTAPSNTNNPVNGAVRTDGKGPEVQEKLVAPKKKTMTKGHSPRQPRDDEEFVLNFDAGLSPNVRRCDRPRGGERVRCQNLAPTAPSNSVSAQNPSHQVIWHIFSDDPKKTPAVAGPGRNGTGRPQ
jgi:hypothetical protein